MSCILPYVLDMFQILLSGNSLRDLWNVCMYCLKEMTVDICVSRLGDCLNILYRTKLLCLILVHS